MKFLGSKVNELGVISSDSKSYHSFLDCVWVSMCESVSRSVASAQSPWTVALQAPLPVAFSRQEHWNGLLCPPPGDLPDPGIEPGSPALQVDSLPSETPGKPKPPWKWLFKTQHCKTKYFWGGEICLVIRENSLVWEVPWGTIKVDYVFHFVNRFALSQESSA